MKIVLAAILPRRSRARSEPADRMLDDFVQRIARYTPCESQTVETEEAFFDWLARQTSRTPVHLCLLDSRGKQISSEELAGKIGRLRDEGTQRLVMAIGPADGWSEQARKRGDLLSFGRITLPHQLARIVLAEQVYRAFTILAGHPYHSGH